MSDLVHFIEMLNKGDQDFQQEPFLTATRVTVKINKFRCWSDMLHGVNKGIPSSVIYMFDDKGNFITSAISL